MPIRWVDPGLSMRDDTSSARNTLAHPVRVPPVRPRFSSYSPVIQDAGNYFVFQSVYGNT